jgi:chorismate synthase
MSIQAVKAVEIGEGWDNASRRGSEAHDAIVYDEAEGYVRPTDRAGGIEGGMSNGALLVARAGAALRRVDGAISSCARETAEAVARFNARCCHRSVPA